ncbi:MAG: CCA tRNA nucleotidyltransferase [Bdellovibrionales bacterium]|nr:CCA tRNA nucleotidyltransferase [Bdellovibrionales bacterium]
MSKKKPKAPKRPGGSKPTPSSRAPTPSADSRSKWIPIEKNLALSASAKDAITRLTGAGFSAYLVGGAVRDFLLGRPSKDFDLATDASPDEVEEIFPNAVDVGRSFGVMKVPYDGGETIEIATFREDAEYTDYRHPKSVRFSGPEEDAARRDFTINGLFYDPKTRRVLDCVGGFADLQAKRLRAIGDPAARLKEDALRVLRAVRFAVRFGFRIEEATWRALVENARFTRKVSAERIRDEFASMLKGPAPHEAIGMLRELGVVSLWLPEVVKVKPAVFSALAADPEPRSNALVFAAALSEAGGEEPEKSLQSACDRLRLSGDEKKRVIDLVLGLPKFNHAFQMREATLRRWVLEPFFDELLQLHRAVARANGGNLMAYRFLKKLRDEASAGPATEKLITGGDLVTLGFSPGPQFSDILRVVDDLQLEKKLNSKDEALEYVVKHFVR